MRSGPILMCLLLAGCNAPGPEMRGVPVRQIVAGPDRFDVRISGGHAQAIRRNARALPRIGDVAAGAERVMEEASGCDVAWLMGDVAVMWGGLSCNGSKPPSQPPKRSQDVYVCDVLRGGGPVTLDCVR